MIASIALLLAIALIANACIAHRALRREIAEAERDPITGVVRGTEAITLAPTVRVGKTSRTACLLVHGFLGSRIDFADLDTRLADEGFAVRVMRLPGHGTTAVDFAWLPDGALLNAVRAEFAALRKEYDKVYVVGFSMGGTICTLLATEVEIDRLALISPYYGVTGKWFYVLPPEWWNALGCLIAPYAKRSDYFVKINDRTKIDTLYSYKVIPAKGSQQLIDLGRQARKPEVLAKVTCPLLLVHSDGDDAASPKRARKAFEQYRSTQKDTLWFERSNHHIPNDFDGPACVDGVVEFMIRDLPEN